jgi:hypothetical protein
MAKILMVAAGLLLLSGSMAPSLAADIDVNAAPHSRRLGETCEKVWSCVGGTCDWQRVCRPVGCPDGYGCYPLYGAYGPYGGSAFWGSFSPRY